MMRQPWQDELDSHLLDCTDELVRLGYDRPAAEQAAKEKFGDEAVIAKELQAIHPWLAVYADWIVLILLLLGFIPLYALHYWAATSLLGLVSDRLLLWWWGGGMVVLALVLQKWQWSIIPLTQRLGMWVALSSGWFIAACVTIALDVNNFETIVYNGLFGLSAGTILLLMWKVLNLTHRQILIMLVVSLMIAFAWQEEGWFEQSLFQNCLYLLDNNPYAAPSSSCQQVSPLSGYFIFIYALLICAVTVLTHYLFSLWKRGIYLYRKMITTGMLICLPFVSFSISGVNSTGILDVVSWKVEIYQAYVDILGRRPEEKDYQFYGTTRSYQHMSEVRSVLYASDERRDKIKLLYEEILGRQPTTEELQSHDSNQQTINQITQQLKEQN